MLLTRGNRSPASRSSAVYLLVSAPSGPVPTITLQDGASDRLVNLYRGRGVPPIWKEGGIGLFLKVSRKPLDLDPDLVDIRFLLYF